MPLTVVSMATVTLPAVPIMRVGTWNASTGKTTVLAEDLASMVAASRDDVVDKPPVKIGHTDKRFATGDGDPAYGWVENLRLSDDGQTLLGDITGVPAKFAEVMKTAWRRRSAEIAWKATTAAGKVYGAVLTGLAVLGVQAPAVKGLGDVMALYSSGEIDPIDTGLEAAGFNIIAFADSDDTPTIPPSQTNAPERVVDQPDSGPDPIMEGAPIVAAANKEKIREALGLKVDATDDEVTAALTEQGFVPATGSDNDKDADKGKGDKDTEETGTPATEVPAPEGELKTAAAAAPVVKVDAAQFAEQQTTITHLSAEVAAFRAEKDAARRDQILDTALRSGKVHVAARSQYRALLDSDEQGTTTLLAALPQMFPVTEFGHADINHTAAGTVTDEKQKAFDRAFGMDY